jgi:thiol-disulfide isomerase/thioredoxin
MIVRLAVVVGVALVCALVAIWWRRREGRFSEGHGRFARADLGLDRGEKPSAVLVEFFGEHCAPCVIVQQRIEKLQKEIPEIGVVSIDAGARLDLADRYEVMRVPTLFVADSALKIIWRASGVPSEDAIRSALLGPDWAGRPRATEAPATGADADPSDRGAARIW